MANVLMIIAQHGFRDEEFLIPKEILVNEGHKVKVASIARASATGMLGAKVMPDFAAHEANADFFDAIVIVGGAGSPALAKNSDVISLVQTAFVKGKILGAICLGPMTLAKAGVLSGKKATVFNSNEGTNALKEGKAICLLEDVVQDGRIVTACGPEAANDFGRKLVEMLKE